MTVSGMPLSSKWLFTFLTVVVEEVIDGDQVVAAVDHKDVCVNFLREFWQLMAHQVFFPLRDLLRTARLAEGSEFLQLSVHSSSEDSLSSASQASFSGSCVSRALYHLSWTLE